MLLHGYPDYDPEELNIKDYDPATYPSWLPLPVYFVDSPDSSFYPECRRTVDRNLDTIVDTLLGTQEFRLPSPEELGAFEESNPHPDDGAWLNRPLEIISGAVILSYAIWIYCGSSADWILKCRC